MPQLNKNKNSPQEKQTYTLVSVLREEVDFYTCYSCKKEIQKGFFCSQHQTLFCEECIKGTTPLKCRHEIKKLNLPFYKTSLSSLEGCTFVPVESIVFKEN